MRRVFYERGKRKAMKVLQKILFTFAMVAGLSFAVMAQKDDQKKPPPKEKPPVVVIPPKNNPPPDSNKPKKPGMAFILWKNETGEIA